MSNLDTREGLAAAQAEYERRKAADPTGFLRHVPDFSKDGFDLATGKVFETGVRVAFGQWEDVEGLEADEDLGAMKAVHGMALGQFRDMVGTFAAVRDDDDPSLNTDGRLKVAVRILKPKLDKLAETAEREFARVDAEIGREMGELERAMRTADAPAAPEIRAYWANLPDAKRNAQLARADRLDDDTLRALATAPAYLSGMSDAQRDTVRKELAQRVDPARVKRVQALREGRALALQALTVLDRRVNRLLDFKRAEKLFEIEAKREAAR